MRSSFFPTGVRTTDDVGRLCGSSLFFTWLFFPSSNKFNAMQREQIHKNWYQENLNQTCLMCWDCERSCSQVSHGCRKTCRWRRRIFWCNCHLVLQFRRFGLQWLGWIISKTCLEKGMLWIYIFCGIDELPNVQVLCCVKELLEQFVPEVHPNDKKSYHLLMHPFILHSIANGCQLRFYEPRLSLCNNLFFPAWVCVGSWLSQCVVFFLLLWLHWLRTILLGVGGPSPSMPRAKARTLDNSARTSWSSPIGSWLPRTCDQWAHGSCRNQCSFRPSALWKRGDCRLWFVWA